MGEGFARPAIVAAARAWIGTPFLHQGAIRGVGCDCLGLIRGVWRELAGAEIDPPPAYPPAWSLACREEHLAAYLRRHFAAIDPAAARPGDVLAFRWRAGLPAAHAAILVAADAMVHALSGAAVAEVPVTRWWRRHLAWTRKHIHKARPGPLYGQGSIEDGALSSWSSLNRPL